MRYFSFLRLAQLLRSRGDDGLGGIALRHRLDQFPAWEDPAVPVGLPARRADLTRAYVSNRLLTCEE